MFNKAIRMWKRDKIMFFIFLVIFIYGGVVIIEMLYVFAMAFFFV